MLVTGIPWVTVAATGMAPFFSLLALVLVVAVFVSLLMVRMRQSLLAGYFLSGVLIANSGALGLVGIPAHDPLIGHLGEVGVILLMFTLGLEFSFSELAHLWRFAVMGGGFQVALTAGLVALVARGAGMGWTEAVVTAFAVALSSTAVAVKSFQEMGRADSPGARLALGVGLFQDILVVFFLLVLPSLYGEVGGASGGLIWAVGKGVIFLGAAVLLARYGNTPLLHAVARTRSRELFTLTAFGICAAVALIAEGMQLSLALGAFAAGLVLSESIYSHRIMGDIQPFKDLFLTIFFISVGLMIDLSVVASDFGIIVAGTVVLMGVKALIVRGVARFLGMGWRSGWMGAVSLASTGEFSLVLMRKAGAIRPFDPRLEQILLACTVLSMAAVPALLRWVRSFSETRSTPRLPDLDPRHPWTLREHAIICGYGPVGCRLNEALRLSGVSTLVLDLNADTVRRLRNEGQPVLFADASHFEALQLAGVEHARLVAFTFPAVAVTLAALPEVRERNAGIVVFARAKFEGDAEALRERDVRVIHDERESAVAMIESVFCVYENAGLTREEILRVTDGSRSGR